MKRHLPKTTGDRFIFCCGMGDAAFCKPEWMKQILGRIGQLPDRTFLIQSKNPRIFRKYQFPSNVQLGTTIETNRIDLYKGISLGKHKAPAPFERYRAMVNLCHPRKVVTLEPLIDFDMDVIVEWVNNIGPEICYVGYDSKENSLPEPELDKVKILITKLKRIGSMKTKPLLLRKAWWERAREGKDRLGFGIARMVVPKLA